MSSPRISIPKNIPLRVFSSNVIDFILNELAVDFNDQQLVGQAEEKTFTPFYQRIGKAATLFAMQNLPKVHAKLIREREKVKKSARFLKGFIQQFSNSFFREVQTLPHRWYPVVVLTFCGIIGAIADFCRDLGRPDLIEVCYRTLELEMHVCLNDLQESGGWKNVYAVAKTFASLYDLEDVKFKTTEATVAERISIV